MRQPESAHIFGFVVFFLFFFWFSCGNVIVVRANAKCRSIPALFNFGDSNSDTGGLAAAAFTLPPPPNGITFFHKPSGRFCDGRLLIDFIAEKLGIPYLDAYLQSVGSDFRRGANFATAGSTIRTQNTTWQQSGFSPFSLDLQVTQFAEFKQRVLAFRSQEPFQSLLPRPQDFDDALYSIDIGQNDLTAGFLLNNFTVEQVEEIIPQVLEEFASQVQDLHAQGAKKFLIFTTGPLGCLPLFLTRLPHTPEEVDKYGCAEPYNKVARAFNSQLRATVKVLQQHQQDSKFIVADGYNLKRSLFVHARKDGFEETVRACCGYGGGIYNYNVSFGFCGNEPNYELCVDPSTYIIWDGAHYTEAANHAVAQAFFFGNFSTPGFSSGHFCDLFT